MKKLFICIITIMLFTPSLMAQTTPQGMKYQAIARDLQGEIIPNQPIELRMTLRSNDLTVKDHYIETHQVTTNKLGLFSLVIGNGNAQLGMFKDIPWSEENIWVTIEIKSQETNEFTVISNSKLLAVPYAFHANTATNVSNAIAIRPNNSNPGVPSQNWSLFGNRDSDPEDDKFGTTDSTDLVIVTNNLERIRIKANGDIITGDGRFTMGGNLEVQGDSTIINNDLYVGKDVRLNYNDEFEPRGTTINYGNFTVDNSSATQLTGTLDVDGETNLESSLNVNNESSTTLTGVLDVDLDGTFGKNVTVTDTLFADVVDTKRFNIKADVPNGEFLATFENTNDSDGDGIKIKLGKTHPGFDGTEYINATNPAAEYLDENINNVRDIIRGEADLDIGMAFDLAPASWIAGSVCGLVSKLIDGLNDALDLPLTSREIAVIINGCDPWNADGTMSGNPCYEEDTDYWDDQNWDLYDDDWVPAPGGGFTIIPDFELNCEDLGLPILTMPNLELTNVANSLTNNNHFIDFQDNGNRPLGYIRAVSIDNWFDNYFDGVFASSFIQKGVGFDPLDAITGLINITAQVFDDYNKIGVEYTSGNGDYAEWLERLNPNEFISKGDIVGVIGGKITKDLENAEQIMAVSQQPIMLGNMPEKNKEYLGNNVAFMGQIPVKVIGAVNSGDYIIANNKVPGYGIAKNPSDVNIDDTKYIVGRSWQTNLNSGPKMVNTVIGVHNGDYLKIIKKFHNEFKQAEKRLDNLESKVDELINNSFINDSSLNN